MPNVRFKEPTIRVNLSTVAADHLDLLQHFSQQAKLLTTAPVLSRAVERYKNCWLPLLVERGHGVLRLSPPLDVYFVWYLHMLQAKKYQNDCQLLCERVLPHELNNTWEEYAQAASQTRGIWLEDFDEPFDLDMAALAEDQENHRTYKLPDFCNRAREDIEFFKEVSLPHYRDRIFLKKAEGRYISFLERLLKLTRVNKVPALDDIPCDIVLMWKTHKLHPGAYAKDVNALFSRLSADTTPPERTSGLFDLVPGTMCRDHQATKEVHIDKGLHVSAEVTDNGQCQISFDDICVEQIWSKDKDLVIEGRHLADTVSIYKTIFEVTGTKGKQISSGSKTGFATVDFNVFYHRGFEFHIYGRSASWCFSGEHHIGTLSFVPRTLFKDSKMSSKEVSVELPRISSTDPLVKVKVKVIVPRPKPLEFRLEASNFRSKDLGNPERSDIDSVDEVFLNPALLGASCERLDGIGNGMEVEEVVSTAAHTLVDRTQTLHLNCKITHCHCDGYIAMDTRLPAVTISDHLGETVSIAHFLKPEELPRSSQVSTECSLTLDPDAGDVAMAIHGHMGEWLICVGRWRIADSKDGFLDVKLYDKDGQATCFSTGKDGDYTFSTEDLECDLESGRIAVSVVSSCIAENLALAFCVAILYVVCQARWKTLDGLGSLSRKGWSLNSSVSSFYSLLRQNSAARKSLGPDHFPLLAAAGKQLLSKMSRRKASRDSSVRATASLKRQTSQYQRSASSSSFSPSDRMPEVVDEEAGCSLAKNDKWSTISSSQEQIEGITITAFGTANEKRSVSTISNEQSAAMETTERRSKEVKCEVSTLKYDSKNEVDTEIKDGHNSDINQNTSFDLDVLESTYL